MSASSDTNPILETLLVFVIVFVVQQLTAVLGSLALMVSLFALSVPVSENPWTVITSVYAHGGLGHLVSNSVGLVVFGWPIARATTRLRFHAFFVVTGAIAGILQVVVTGELPFVGASVAVLGASGAVFALMGYLLAGNRLSEGIAARVGAPWWVTLVFFLVLAVAITLATAAPQSALIAHFIGFLLGLVAGRGRILEVKQA